MVVGGHVYPAELEELLLSHPAVARCAVFGTRDEELAEHVNAAVVPAPDSAPPLEEIRDFVTAARGASTLPTPCTSYPKIPLTAAGKPDKKLLRARLSG